MNNIPDPNNPGQTTSISYPLNIVYAKPAVVSAVPDSYAQSTATQLQADGGYFGANNNPLVELLFNGQLTPNDQVQSNTRQLVGPLQGSATTTPGLYPVSVVWHATTPPNPPPFQTATTNIAVQPTFTAGSNPLNSMYFSPASSSTPQKQILTPPSIALPPLGTVTNLAPSSIAVNSTKGYAVITEQAANAIQIVTLVPNTNAGVPPGRSMPQAMSGGNMQVAVGSQPTSVAIDNQINLSSLGYPGEDMAVVVNSGDSTLSLLAVSPTNGVNVIGTVNLQNLVPGVNVPPYAVGVDPSTHYAVVAFGNPTSVATSTVGFVVDVNPLPHTQTCFTSSQATSPPCAIASVSLNTGATPQVVMQPNVPLAYVTPGGAGATSVVSLLLTDQSVTIAPPSSSTPSQGGVACPSGASTATITTVTANNLSQNSPGVVLISGVSTNSPTSSTVNFNGTYSVITGSVSTYSFAIPFTCPTVSGGGTYGGNGTITFGNPYYTFSTTTTAVGGAINPISGAFAFADPQASNSAPQVAFISALDQSVSSLYLTAGSCNGCSPTPTGAPEVGMRYVAWDPFLNLVIAYNPQNTYNEVSLIDPGGPTPTGVRSPSRLIQAIQMNLSGSGGQGSYTPPGSTTPVTVYGPMGYDPRTNLVLVANAGSNTLSYLDLDPYSTFKKTHIQNIQVTSGGVASGQPPLAGTTGAPSPLPVAVCDPTSPTNIYASCFPQAVTVGQSATVKIFGQGLNSGGRRW